MTVLSRFLLAIALLFSGAPLCAVPSATPIAMGASECADMLGKHKASHDGDRDLRSIACHSCALSFGVASAFEGEGSQLIPDPIAHAVTQRVGASIEPPTPPPRTAGFSLIAINNGVRT